MVTRYRLTIGKRWPVTNFHRSDVTEGMTAEWRLSDTDGCRECHWFKSCGCEKVIIPDGRMQGMAYQQKEKLLMEENPTNQLRLAASPIICRVLAPSKRWLFGISEPSTEWLGQCRILRTIDGSLICWLNVDMCGLMIEDDWSVTEGFNVITATWNPKKQPFFKWMFGDFQQFLM